MCDRNPVLRGPSSPETSRKDQASDSVFGIDPLCDSCSLSLKFSSSKIGVICAFPIFMKTKGHSLEDLPRNVGCLEYVVGWYRLARFQQLGYRVLWEVFS